jgi:hypothetical protein
MASCPYIDLTGDSDDDSTTSLAASPSVQGGIKEETQDAPTLVTRTRHSMEPQTPPALHARSEAHPTESLGMAMGATSSGNELMNTTPFVSPANKQHSNQSEHDTQMDGTDVSSNADISTSPGAPTEAERAAVSNNHASDAQESTCIEPTTADELSTPQLKHEEEDEIDLSLPLANSESQVEVFDRPETSDAPTDEQFEHSYSNMLQGVCDLFVCPRDLFLMRERVIVPTSQTWTLAKIFLSLTSIPSRRPIAT